MFSGMTTYVMVAVPLFIFMANMLERSGVADDLYNAVSGLHFTVGEEGLVNKCVNVRQWRAPLPA